MNKIFLPVMMVLLAACNTSSSTDQRSVTDSANTVNGADALTQAYTQSVEIGDSKFAQAVLDIYRFYDNNIFDSIKGLLADTVSMGARSGKHYTLSRDSAVALLAQSRMRYSQYKSMVDAYVTVKFKYNMQNTWVAVWGQQEMKTKAGMDTIAVNENWGFDEKGKISIINQFSKPYIHR